MKHLKKAAIIGMSVLTAAAVPAILVANNHNVQTNITTMSASVENKDVPLVEENDVTESQFVTSTIDDRQKINDHVTQDLESLIWLVAGGSIMLILIVICAILLLKIKKVNDLKLACDYHSDSFNL